MNFALLSPLAIGIARSILLLGLFSNGAHAGQHRIRGRVVNENGLPAANAAVAHYWRANGPRTKVGGMAYDFKKDDDVRLFWGNVGEMVPTEPAPAIKTGRDGQFAMTMPDTGHTLMVMDEKREAGALVVLPKGKETEPLDIRMEPLVLVRGSFEGPRVGQRPFWTHVYLNLQEDPTRPLDAVRFASCGSFDANFKFALPSGAYSLHAYSAFEDGDDFEGGMDPDKLLTIARGVREIDLGTLKFSPHRVRVRTMEKKSKETGTWSDHTKHFGEAPPAWHITDSRGVDKNVQVSAYRGKWVMLYFWGLSCAPCLRTGLPKMVKFYEDHAAEKNRFEILAIEIEPDGDFKSMAEVDTRLDRIIREAWNNKPLPFPVLLDPTFLTWERFGLAGLGQIILIDPEGHLFPGDEKVLAEKLIGSLQK